MTSFILEKNQKFSKVFQFKKLTTWLFTQNFDSQTTVKKAEFKGLKENHQNKYDAYSTALNEYKQEINHYQNCLKNQNLKEAQELRDLATANRLKLIEFLINAEKYEEFLQLLSIDLYQAQDFALSNGATPRMWINFYGK